jgi:hypothetical protein
MSIPSPVENTIIHSCILRGSGKLHFCILKKDTGSDRSATGLMSKVLSRLFLSTNKGANYTSSPKKAHKSMANEKNPPNPELKHP